MYSVMKIHCCWIILCFFLFFWVPSHARFSVQWVMRSLQSATVSLPVLRVSCGRPLDWAMSGVSECQWLGRNEGCGWEREDLCHMRIHLDVKFSGRGVDSVQFSVWLELLCPAGEGCPLLFQCVGVVATLSWSCFLGWSLLHGRA